MKSLIFVFSLFFLFGIQSPVNASDSDEKEYTISGNLNPKIINKIPLPKEMTSGGAAAINGNYLWVSGSEQIEIDGKRGYRTRIAIFDISIPEKPKLMVIHDAPDFSRRFQFYKNYAYLVYNKPFIQKPSPEQKNLSRYGIKIYEISDIFNPIPINELESIFFHFPDIYLDADHQIMYVLDSSSSDMLRTGHIDQTKIYKFSLEDPANPKQIPCKIITKNKKELKVIDDYIQEIQVRDNYLYALGDKDIYVFDTSGNNLVLIDKSYGTISTLNCFCLAEEYILKDSVYIFAGGENADFYYPGKNLKPNEFLKQHFVAPFIHSTALAPYYTSIGQTSGGVRIPFGASFIYSKGTLIYLHGHELNYEIRKTTTSNSKFLIVDFSYFNDPQFEGYLEFDGSIMDCEIKEENNKLYGYLTVYKKEGNEYDAPSKLTLYVVELPIKEGVFGYKYTSREELYPEYSKVEIKPNPLETTLRDFINKISGDLTEADFKDIKSLDFEDKNLTDICGIELCTNLEELNLANNKITDITPLSNLKQLKVLDLSANKITNIEPIGYLTNLEELKLDWNDISDISPLKSLNKLQKLSLDHIKASDFTPISQIASLTDLRLRYNHIFKPPSFKNLINLKTLDLLNNDIYHTDFVKELAPSVEKIILWGNRITDVSNFSHLTNLKCLDLLGNNIKDISPLQHLTNLEELNISDNKGIADLSPISHLINLKKLDISELEIDNLGFLANLTNLENLDISHINFTPKKIKDLTPLSNLKKLKILRARQNLIDDLRPLAGLIELTTLHLGQNKIKNIDALRNLSNLEYLDLSENKISEITPIVNLEKLKSLTIIKNEIKDITPLLNGKIQPDCEITIGENPIPKGQIDSLRRKFLLLPNEYESSSLYNLILIASAEIKYKDAYGKYTPDIKELFKSGLIYYQGDINRLTIDTIVRGFDVSLFEVKDDRFTIVITPKSHVPNARTFAITEEGVLYEWLGDGKPDVSRIDFDNDWKKWPKDCKFSIYSCSGTG